MEYKVDSVELAVNKNGGAFKKVVVSSKYKGAIKALADEKTPFYNDLIPGKTVRATIDMNAKYKWMKKEEAEDENADGVTISLKDEVKDTGIKHFQDRKNDSIAFFNALNNAIEIVKARNGTDFDMADIYEVQSQLLKHWDDYKGILN